MSDLHALTAQLRNERMEARIAAAEQLGQLGSAARSAACALVNATADEQPVRDWAVTALEQLGPPPADTVPELATLANSGHELIAYWAITLLGRLKIAATRAEQALVTALDTSAFASVRQRAAWALGSIGDYSASALEPLRRASRSADPRLARLASQALQARTRIRDGC